MQSVLSAFLGSADANFNLNHLQAHFVVICSYYFVPKLYFGLFNRGMARVMLLSGFKVAFLLLFVTVLLDYFLMLYGLNVAELSPFTKSSPIVGSGFMVRPKGFFVEPTDLAMAVNAIGLVVMFSRIDQKNGYLLFILMYVIMLVLSRSGAGIFGLLIAVLLAIFISVLISVSGYGLRNKRMLIAVSVLMGLSIYIFSTIDFFSDIYDKVSLVNSSSASARLNAWLEMLQLYNDRQNYLFGSGTGYLSGNGLMSLSWTLTLLVENGLIGVLIYLSIIAVATYVAIDMSPGMRFGYLVALFSTVIHLSTQSGFYFPFFWFLVFMSNMLASGGYQKESFRKSWIKPLHSGN